MQARWQWHLNVLHGYQFFDLDGREPDTAMICYGRDAIYPTIDFERCREGAEDFYLMQTLRNAIGRAKDSGAPAEYLDALTANVKLNQHTPPPGYDAYKQKAEIVKLAEHLQGRRD